jgi:hypothetical protein
MNDDQQRMLDTKTRTTVIAYIMITIGMAVGVGLLLLKFFQP